jgi:hypothetical protein
MKRSQQHEINLDTIKRVRSLEVRSQWQVPSYAAAVSTLNAEGFQSSRGRAWTVRSLYRMLQRQGFRGLWGLFRDSRK